MIRRLVNGPANSGEGWGRRDVLRMSAAGAALGLSGVYAPRLQAARAKAKNCIVLMLVGGPSQLDTWDPKPEAPSEIRGPYRAIRTNAPGVRISEIFPQMARRADKYALVRSCYHEAAAVHDTGHQLLQTGRLFTDGVEYPHAGCVLAKWAGAANALLPGPIGKTGGNMPHGQTAGFLGADYDPAMPDAGEIARELARTPERERAKYGPSRFGQNCLMARRMVEAGTRFVTVNMFDTVFDRVTWDMHGYRPFSPMSSYRDEVGPAFDAAYSALLDDLARTGLLRETLVVAMGEFGRSPKINPAGGRDHWTDCWTVVMAGGGVQGGQTIGASDAMGAAPKDRPVAAAEIAATIYHALGIPLDLTLPDEKGMPVRLLDRGTEPVRELFS